MSGLQTHDFSTSLRITKAPKEQQESNVVMTSSSETKPKKKICCACPDTKKLRDECVVEQGESACSKWIEAHRLCLRSEGFNWFIEAWTKNYHETELEGVPSFDDVSKPLDEETPRVTIYDIGKALLYNLF